MPGLAARAAQAEVEAHPGARPRARPPGSSARSSRATAAPGWRTRRRARGGRRAAAGAARPSASPRRACRSRRCASTRPPSPGTRTRAAGRPPGPSPRPTTGSRPAATSDAAKDRTHDDDVVRHAPVPASGRPSGDGCTSMPTPVLVHDYLLVLRGAERTFAAMTDVWPQAPIATLLYDEAGTAGRLRGALRARPRGSSCLGAEQRNFRALLPLLPFAAAALPVDDHDVIVSSSSAFAHGVRKRPGSLHLCYCHSPFRYAWHERDRALAEVPAAAAPGPGRPPAPPPGLRPPRRRAGGPLPGQLAAHPRADPPLLGPRLRRRAPPGRRRALRAGRARRAPALRRRAGRPQARRRRDRGRGRGRPRDPVVGDGPGARAARGALRRAGGVPRAPARRGARARLRRGRGARRPERRGVRDRGRRGPGRGPAGRRRRRGRRPRDGGRRAHRGARPAGRPRRARAGPARRLHAASTPPRSTGTRSASRARPSRSGWPPRSTR